MQRQLGNSVSLSARHSIPIMSVQQSEGGKGKLTWIMPTLHWRREGSKDCAQHIFKLVCQVDKADSEGKKGKETEEDRERERKVAGQLRLTDDELIWGLRTFRATHAKNVSLTKNRAPKNFAAARRLTVSSSSGVP